MKKTISLLIASLAFSLVFTACNQDNEADLYQSDDKSAVSFVANYTEYAMGADATSVSVPVCREDASAEASATLASLESDIFTLASNTVTFKAGETIAYAVINANLDKMTFGESYEVELKLDSKVNAFAYSTINLVISRTLSWSPMEEEGLFESTAMEGSWKVKMQKADQTTFYIVENCYETGKNIEFQIKGNVVTVAKQPAWTHSSYGTVSVAGTGTYENGVATVELEHSVSAGSFGKFIEKLHIPAK